MKRRFRQPIRIRRWFLLFFVLAIGGFALTISHTSACPAPAEPSGGDAAMQAILFRCYGPASVLQLERVD